MIQIYQSPDQSQWEPLLKRPLPETENLHQKVEEIIQAVKIERDQALYRFTRNFDKVDLTSFMVTEQEMITARSSLHADLITAIIQARSNIETFHHSQVCNEQPVETMTGVTCWRNSRPIERVGLYIPGGSAPLFSTVLMLAIPARIAGCKEIILCTPPQKDGTIHPAILYAAGITGVTKIFKLGGAQAIAAMALGTQSIPQVDKIFGPGNHFVTEAKVAAQQLGVAIDLPAGPSEVLIIADHSANPDFVAADMISQAEHGADSQVVLLTTHLALVDKTNFALEQQLRSLPRADIARSALQKSMIIQFDSIIECLSFSNRYAPEHLILCVDEPGILIPEVINAGSVFLGHYSPESVGDYASGTNHTLPTGGWARSYSGVSVDSFVKKITFQQLTPQGLASLGPHVEMMAEAESLIGHKRAVSIRLNSLL